MICTKVNQDNFKTTKTLLDLNLSVKKISDIVKLAPNTIYLIEESDNLDDYTKKSRQRYLEAQAKKNGDSKEVTAKSFDETNTIVSVLKAIEHSLNRQADLMEKMLATSK